MKSNIKFDDIVSAVLLNFDNYDVVIVVEGDSDKCIYERYVDHEICYVFQGEGKNNVIALVEKINNITQQYFTIGIIDSDFDKITKQDSYPKNIFPTDDHDLESMIIKSEAFNKVVLALCVKKDKMTERPMTNKEINELRLSILDNCKIIGSLRLLIMVGKLNNKYALKNLHYSNFYLDDNMSIDIDLLIHEITGDELSFIEKEYLKNEISKVLNENYDIWQICCGDDLINIFSLIIRRNIGEKHSKNISSYKLSQELRLAYEYYYFKDTNLFKEINIWQTTNNFKLFI